MTCQRLFIALSAIAVLSTSIGCQTCSQSISSCGQEIGCGDGGDPLIIFIGADRDVAKMGKLPQVAEDFRRCGYNAVYFDPWKQLNDPEHVAAMIRQQVRCRGGRVMLVGWSYGAVVGLKAMEIVRREGICVDSFVEIDCFNLTCHMGDCFHPTNAGKVTVIRSQLNREVEGYRCPTVYRLDTCWHLGLPSHDTTRCIITREANRIRAGAMNASIYEPQSLEAPTASAPLEAVPIEAAPPARDVATEGDNAE